jgi:hypothetical protein
METEGQIIRGHARRFIKVAPPTVHAGIGSALRQAFDMNGEARSFTKFQDLLDRLG